MGGTFKTNVDIGNCRPTKMLVEDHEVMRAYFACRQNWKDNIKVYVK
jgi:hypothetical protein